MASELGRKDPTVSHNDPGVKRRGLLRFGTLITAFTGASAISAIGASSAHAGAGDKTPPNTYVPIAEKGAPLGVAALDSNSKVPLAQLPDLSAKLDSATAATTYTKLAGTNTITAKNLFTGPSNLFGQVSEDALYKWASQQHITCDDWKIIHNVQGIIDGDFTGDAGFQAGIVFGSNWYTTTGSKSRDAHNTAGIYGALIETAVRAPDSTIGFVIGLQAEASFATPTAGGAVTGSMTSLKVAAPSRKDGATAGDAGRVYGLYIERVPTHALNSNASYSLYQSGGTAYFDDIGSDLESGLWAKKLVVADRALTTQHPSGISGANMMWVQANSGTSNALTIQNYPGVALGSPGGQTADPFRLMSGTSPNGAALFAINAYGIPKWRDINTQTTVGGAGAASTLPPTPTKYLKVTDSTGAKLVIPAYAA